MKRPQEIRPIERGPRRRRDRRRAVERKDRRSRRGVRHQGRRLARTRARDEERRARKSRSRSTRGRVASATPSKPTTRPRTTSSHRSPRAGAKLAPRRASIALDCRRGMAPHGVDDPGRMHALMRARGVTFVDDASALPLVSPSSKDRPGGRNSRRRTTSPTTREAHARVRLALDEPSVSRRSPHPGVPVVPLATATDMCPVGGSATIAELELLEGLRLEQVELIEGIRLRRMRAPRSGARRAFDVTSVSATRRDRAVVRRRLARVSRARPCRTRPVAPLAELPTPSATQRRAAVARRVLRAPHVPRPAAARHHLRSPAPTMRIAGTDSRGTAWRSRHQAPRFAVDPLVVDS